MIFCGQKNETPRKKVKKMDELHVMAGAAWLVLSVIGRWLLFRKAGRCGLLSLIPVVNVFVEYNICWSGGKALLSALLAGVAGGCVAAGQDNPVLMGVAAAAVFLVLLIHWKESMKLAASYGKGSGYGFFLFLFSRLGRVVLGLSSAEYEGKESGRARRMRPRYAER